MKNGILLLSVVLCALANAQTAPPIIRNPLTTYKGLKIDSRKGTLIEKQTVDFAKFKNLNIQKIITKDLSDNSAESVLGIMYEYETFDHISKKTLTIEKTELSKLIHALQILEQKEKEAQSNNDTKYKFVTMSNIEFGGVYSEKLKSSVNYIKMPSAPYGQNLNEFNTDELKELIKILKKAEQEL